MKRLLFGILLLVSLGVQAQYTYYYHDFTGYSSPTYPTLENSCDNVNVVKDWGVHFAYAVYQDGSIASTKYTGQSDGSADYGSQQCAHISVTDGNNTGPIYGPHTYPVTIQRTVNSTLSQTNAVVAYEAPSPSTTTETFVAATASDVIEVAGSSTTVMTAVTVKDSGGTSIGTAVHSANGTDWIIPVSGMTIGNTYSIGLTAALIAPGIAPVTKFSVKIPALGKVNAAQTPINWTPVLTFGGANAGMTGTFNGTYSVNGKQVTAYYQITLTNKGTSTGTAVLSAPISQDTTSVNCSGGGVVTGSGFMTGLPSSLYTEICGTTVYIKGEATTGQAFLTSSAFTNTTYIYGHFTYISQ